MLSRLSIESGLLLYIHKDSYREGTVVVSNLCARLGGRILGDSYAIAPGHPPVGVSVRYDLDANEHWDDARGVGQIPLQNLLKHVESRTTIAIDKQCQFNDGILLSSDGEECVWYSARVRMNARKIADLNEIIRHIAWYRGASKRYMKYGVMLTPEQLLETASSVTIPEGVVLPIQLNMPHVDAQSNAAGVAIIEHFGEGIAEARFCMLESAPIHAGGNIRYWHPECSDAQGPPFGTDLLDVLSITPIG